VVCAEADKAPAVSRTAIATNSFFITGFLSLLFSRALSVTQPPAEDSESPAELFVFLFGPPVLARLISFNVMKIGMALTFAAAFPFALVEALVFV
jgi:hypothetical protein